MLQHKIEDAVKYMKELINDEPGIGMILGSGLGDLADEIDNATLIDYSNIPHFPVSTVEGHAGRFVIGEFEGKQVIAMQGRFHFYEGYHMNEVTFAVRVMKLLGVEKLLVTNAAGAVNRNFKPGNLMLISDHLNFMGTNPLMGHNLKEFGVRFPDMSDAYSKDLREKVKTVASTNGIEVVEGVYCGYSGPSYETPAEIRMFRTLGADAVGMSTVPEVIVAVHSGIKVLGISCLTNMAAGILDQPLSHEEVTETATRVKQDFVSLVRAVIREVL
ncbi:purine-nucleoside phosphorylase [Vallitalea okinawensis]|uniref:purine-nucleoside phosphorylase n=1 Tax=Vallitalea okinawensis TaxID=2078660 RepID=UPI000CFB6C3B|nr:purine-nucleoside phosphorylase [Vallitalea okinawensis]